MEKAATKYTSQTVHLGLMAPLSGIVGLYGAEIGMAGRIACDEVNEAGGVLGRPLELLIEDDASLPPSSVAAAKRLIDGHECVAIIGNLLSNSRIAVAYQVAEPRRIPYLNFSFYEGSILSHYFFHFAALPNQQIDRMIPYMRDRFGPRMFFAGNNYEWPRGSIDAAKRVLEQSGGEVAGEEYCPIGVGREEIERLLDQVAVSRADVFVPYFAGADQIELLTRFSERGLKERMAVVMGHFDEVMARILTPEVREGFYSSNTYFMTLDTRENGEYLARLSRQPGVNGIWPHGNGILTNFGEGAYLCVKAFAQAANQVGSLDSEALIAALQMIAVSGPQGVVTMDPVTHHARVNTYLSRCRADGAFEIIERFGAIAPVLPERYRHMRIVRQSEPEDIYLHSRMMAQMTEAVFLVRAASGVIVHANPGAGRMFGYGEDELKGKGFPALLAPSGRSAEETVAFIGAMLARKGVWEGETENITGDGRRFWCAFFGSVFTHPSHGEVWMLLGRDITERKRAEAKLKEYQEHLEDLVKERTEELAHSNAQLSTVLDNITEGLVVADLDGNLLHWNPAAVEMHGLASEEEGKRRLVEFGNLFELSTEKDGILPVEKWPLARILKGEELRDWEVCVRRLDRDCSGVFNFGGTVARDNDGKPILAIVTMADITERKRAEEERETSVEFLRLVNESRDTAGLIRAAAGYFHEKSGCEAVGIRVREGDDYPYFESRGFPEEFILLENSLCDYDENGGVVRDCTGNPVINCMCGNVICGRFDPSKPFFTTRGSFWSNCTTDLLATTTEADRQARTRNCCNGEGYESVALIPLRSGDESLGLLQLNDRRKGRFTPETIALWERLAGYLSVALSRFEAEDALHKAHGELARLVEERTAELREKEVLLKEVHHRVKNNLQVISSLVSLQAGGSTDESVREVLRDVTYRVRSMALVHEKLYQSEGLSRIDFAEYARSLLSYLWSAHGGAAANVRLTLALEPVLLPVDTAVPCGLILNELAGNALKHAFRGRSEGEVIVSLKNGADGRISLCVADNGVGLPAGLDWREAKSLGLRLVQMLSGQIGGEVKVSGGEGTRFEISFGL
jgi:PAS domain S-box-containing protein